ncbi:MAG: DUF2795 domain-containing protein [Nitrososphaerota archaeon]|nr:DUF2795 domain-containing protein [Nitrososphaerota archaeon]
MVRGEGTTAQGSASPTKIQHSLKGAHYPSSKNDLVRLAKNNSAPSDVLSILDVIPNKEYSSPADLMKEIGKKE